ncbi:MAG: hypothetical protein IIA07_03145 [Proteobacteria bacterium]|nr:hypothetical protein [Pseudomonadota bacterium]
MNEKPDDQLIAAASKLSTEISPERDLWPEIASAINRSQRSRWTPRLAQAAAVVLLVGASSMVTYLAVKDDGPGNDYQPSFQVTISPDLLFEQTAYGNLSQEYHQARGNVVAQLDRELGKLSPEVRADVERNLAVIRQAMGDINTALAKEPDNALLQGLLAKAYRDELVIMNRVGSLTRRLMSRQDI